MESVDPISFHGGKRRRFDQSLHFDAAFVGDDEKNKKIRYKLYKDYCKAISDEYKEYKAEVFDESIKTVFDALQSSADKPLPDDIVELVAIMFFETSIPSASDFFDSLMKDGRLGEEYHIIRLKAGHAYSSIELVINDVLQQAPPKVHGGTAIGFQSLLQWRKKEAKSEVKPLLFVLDDILSFNSRVLEDFLFILAQYKSFGLSISVTAGFPHSNSINALFPSALLRKFTFETVAVSTTLVITKLIDFISDPKEMPFRLSPKAMTLLSSTVQEIGLTAEEFVHILKLIIFEHFRSKIDSVYCLPTKKLNKEALATPKKRRQSKIGDADALKADEYRSRNWIGSKIFSELINFAEPELAFSNSNRPPISDDDFFETDFFQQTISAISSFDRERILEFLDVCEKILDEFPVGTSNILTPFRADLTQHGCDLKNLEKLQEEEKKRIAESTPANVEEKRQTRSIDPNRSSRMNALLANVGKSIASQKVDVLAKKQQEIEKTLKKFFKHALAPPSEEAVATMFFDDLEFLRRILSPSSREILSAALSDPAYGIRYDIYDRSGLNIDLAKWFREFKDSQEDIDGSIDDEIMAAKFYEMLSSMEFVGFIAKSRKKGHVTKLCWTTTVTD